MKTAIIIPTYNNSEYTVACLRSIQENTKDYVVIWVDDGSDLEHFENVSGFLIRSGIPHHILKNDVNSGFVTSVNKGLEFFKTLEVPYVVIQNNDTIVYDKWLETMINVAESDEKIAIVGPLTSCSVQDPRQMVKKYPDFPRDIAEKFKTCDEDEEFAKFLQEKHQRRDVQVYERVAFFSTLIKSDVINDIGVLSDEYGFGYYDDDDYCERVLRSGRAIHVSCGTFVSHVVEQTFAHKKYDKEWIQKKREIYAKNRDIFEKKFGYGNYEEQNVWDMSEDQLRVRLWRKQKSYEKLENELNTMKNSVFWKMREKYMKLKDVCNFGNFRKK